MVNIKILITKLTKSLNVTDSQDSFLSYVSDNNAKENIASHIFKILQSVAST